MSETSDPGQEPGSSDLQFDHPELESGESNDLACDACSQAVSGAYYRINGAVTCDSCRRASEHAKPETSGGMRRFGRALLYGGLAAIVGTIVYFLILWGTGYEVGLIAIAVGWMVGKAVFAGSGGRGGMKYQLLAAGLTYLSICSSYAPMVYQGLTEPVEESADESGAVTLEADTSGAAGEGGPPLTAEELANAQPAPENIEDVETGVVYTVETNSETETSVVGLVVVGVVVFAVALAAPFLAGLENLIGLFIIGIGLWEAWKANAIPVTVVEGPFSAGAEGEGPTSDGPEAHD